jgi:hypothetical protein
MPNGNPVRVIVCQGIAQMVAAFAAIEQNGQQPEESSAFQNRIVLFGLFSPAEREAATLRMMESLAGRLSPFPILHFSDLELGTLKDLPWKSAIAVALDLIGGVEPRELYLGREWLWGNEFFLRAFPRAKKICYGDSLGIYYSENFATPNGMSANIYFSTDGRKASLRQRLSSWLRRTTPNFDEAYLLRPGTFELPKAALIHELQPNYLRSVLNDLSQSQIVTLALRHLPEAPTAILLTSNCSESQRISREQELDGYLERILESPPKCFDRLWIKPHPREQREKLDALVVKLERHFHEVNVLEEDLAVLPFELIWQSIHRDWKGLELPKIYSFGATSVSLSRLFGIETEFGFGEKRVAKDYFPAHRDVRLRFENAVLAAVAG